MVKFLDLGIALIALLIALVALLLQKKEIKKNGQLNALVHTAHMIESKINFHNRIIEEQKNKGYEYEIYKGHAERINNELRPLLKKVNKQFYTISGRYDDILNEEDIHKILRDRKNEAI